MTRFAVLDFETTGLSPAEGARPTEIAVVLVEDGRITARFQSLMNAGVRVPPFIERLTGISNAMLRTAPPLAEVMAQAAEFAGERPLLAHNAAFDRKFWDDALARIGRQRRQEFHCSLLLARRLYAQAPGHKLEALARHLDLPVAGQFHRALADAEVTAHLLLHMRAQLCQRFGVAEVSEAQWLQVQRMKIGSW